MIERITFEEYRALPGINWSQLKHMATSPLRFQYEATHERTDTATFQLGRAIHCAVLEPDEFPLRYAVFTGDRRAGKSWEEFKAANADRDAILKADEYRKCLEIRDAVHAHRVAGPLLSQGEVETTRQWTDEESGLLCKARLDHVSSVSLTDLKSASSVEARDFTNAIARYLYHGQLAHYLESLEEPVPVRIIAVEKEPPYEVAVFLFPEWVIDAGRVLRRRLLSDLVRCQARDEWPCMYESEQEVELPSWADESDGAALGGGWDL